MTKAQIVTAAVSASLILTMAACGSDDETTTTGDSASAVTDEPSPITNAPSETPDTTSPSSESAQEEIAERSDHLRDALANGDFTTMLDLLELSGLSEELEGREVTVLAPTEEAFQGLTVDELTELATDADRAEELLRHHVLEGLYTYDELTELTEVTTIDGDTLPVATSGDELTIGDATVSAPAADALAGEEGQEAAVFGIDTLLLDQA